ncbi:MAG: 3'-5' exoribonuclease [Fibrobacter sp.]|jgi:DNA polymerase-3 subunit epsilon|nr:3'-5' exoribonuclease [Fibrobacter sp.]
MRFAVIDLETTGGLPGRDRIIEIGIVVIENNEEVKHFQTFVDPERDIPEFVRNLTGITEAQVRRAPSFYQVADTVEELLHGAVFVAHNAAFDYRFLKFELERLGKSLHAPRLCTVKLARKIFPGKSSYSLHKLTTALDLSDFKHHRALGDAQAAAEILKLALEKAGAEKVTKEITGYVRPEIIPKRWEHEEWNNIPERAGILYFLGKEDQILYVCGARNLYAKVLESLKSKKKGALKNVHQGLYDIRFEETGTELIAQLKLAVLLHEHRPPCNISSLAPSDNGAPIPDMVLIGAGRTPREKSAVVVKNNQVPGYCFLSEHFDISLPQVLESLHRFPAGLSLTAYIRPALQNKAYRAIFI